MGTAAKSTGFDRPQANRRPQRPPGPISPAPHTQLGPIPSTPARAHPTRSRRADAHLHSGQMLHTLAPHWRYIWLVLASFIAGVLNAMAGGGSFISFPAMLGVGVPPIQANATNTVALWPGQLTSLAALRSDLRRDLLPAVLAASLLGGTIGAVVLLHTGQAAFVHLIPWLLLTGALLFWAATPVSHWLRARSRHRSHSPAALGAPASLSQVAVFFALLPICFYIGYFGAGSGFLIMTALALLGLEEVHQLNALKVVAACVSNLCATITFIVSGFVLWHFCLISMLFAAAGGWAGARYARRANPTLLRTVVVVTGLLIAAWFFYRQHAAGL